MAIRGTVFALATELGACLLIVTVFIALTLLPAGIAIALFVLILAAIFTFIHRRRNQAARRIDQLEQEASIKRAQLKAQQIQGESQHYGTGVR
jgi:Flp pilus assembly protein TadB